MHFWLLQQKSAVQTPALLQLTHKFIKKCCDHQMYWTKMAKNDLLLEVVNPNYTHCVIVPSQCDKHQIRYDFIWPRQDNSLTRAVLSKTKISGCLCDDSFMLLEVVATSIFHVVRLGAELTLTCQLHKSLVLLKRYTI